ncbi:MAG: hypothetical protein CVU42_17700 [Chloroflexi bacterium HGW-Chloroflexi-4]|jgi:hypothetical protein|nr:MAG: hypothetical protein CVU42_17700 [Chloroflexi bacterium HGW-Chloroflexi-4]
MNEEVGTITVFYKDSSRNTILSGIDKDVFEHLNECLLNYTKKRFFKPIDRTYRLNAKKYEMVLVLSDISSIQWVGDNAEVGND